MGRPTCKGCGDPVVWKGSVVRNRSIMLDPAPDPVGTAVVVSTCDGPRVKLLSRAEADALPPATTRYRVHADRCPALRRHAYLDSVGAR